MRATATAGILVAAVSATGIQTTLLVLGAVVFALASWRRDTRNVLRQQNLDLSERNQTLEKDLQRSKELIDSLNSRPNLDQQAAVLTNLIEKLADHDQKQGERDDKILELLAQLAQNVHANTTALGFWIGDKQARDFT